MIKKSAALIAALCLTLCASGCSGGSIYSNYLELEQLSVIEAMGFDYAPDGVRLSVSSGKSTSAPARLSADAKSLSLAEQRIQDYSSSEQLFYAHTAYLAVGAESAEKSIEPFLDYLKRSADMRLDIPLFTVYGGEASELVLGAGNSEYDATNVFKSLERNVELRGEGVIFSAADIAAALSENGCALVYAVRIKNADNAVEDAKPDELTALPDGFTVIKNGTAVGKISADDVIGVNLLLSRAGPSLIALSADDKTATVQIDKCRCDIAPVIKHDTLTGIDVKLVLDAALCEIQGEPDTQALERELEAKLAAWIKSILLTSQELECDFLQLGATLERSSPRTLRGLGGTLSALLPTLYINVSVDASLDRSFDLGLEN